MRAAVTGSSGLIGSALVHTLRAEGHEPIPVLRRGNGGGAPSAALHWDPDAGTIDADGFEGLDAVVHLAGAGIGDKKWTPERKQLILESRTRGTGLLARALADLRDPPRVLVSASGVGYYGNRGDELLTEESSPGADFPAQV